MLVLYALIRTDLATMGYGKGSAQAMHAANLFTDKAIIQPLLAKQKPDAAAMQWRESANGFGTTLTLAVSSLKAIADVVSAADTLGFQAGIVLDPTYPYLVTPEIAGLINPVLHTQPSQPAGKNVVCFREEQTVGYVFGEKENLEVLLARFGLLNND